MRKAMPKPLNDSSQGDSEVACLMLTGTEVFSSSVRIFSTADCVVTKIAFPHAKNSLPSNTPSRRGLQSTETAMSNPMIFKTKMTEVAAAGERTHAKT